MRCNLPWLGEETHILPNQRFPCRSHVLYLKYHLRRAGGLWCQANMSEAKHERHVSRFEHRQLRFSQAKLQAKVASVELK
jgi:hypothetical protein